MDIDIDMTEQSRCTALSEQATRDKHVADLLCKAESHNLELYHGGNVPYNGDCLFQTILNLRPGIAIDSQYLRSELVDAFKQKVKLLLSFVV